MPSDRSGRRSSRAAVPPDIPLVVTKAEAAQPLKIGPRAIQRLVAQGKLRAVGRNSGRRIIYASILEYLAADSAA